MRFAEMPKRIALSKNRTRYRNIRNTQPEHLV